MGLWTNIFFAISFIIFVLGIVFLILWLTNKTKYEKYRIWGIVLTILGVVMLIIAGVLLYQNNKVKSPPINISEADYNARFAAGQPLGPNQFDLSNPYLLDAQGFNPANYNPINFNPANFNPAAADFNPTNFGSVPSTSQALSFNPGKG